MTKKSEELDRLWELHHKAYLNGDGEYYRNKLLEASLSQIKIIADKINLRISSNVELDDLKQEGVFGAIKAIKSFNPNKAKFVTHLNRKVRSRIFDYLREQDWAPRLVRQRARQLEQAKSKLDYNSTEKQLIGELSKDKYLANPQNKEEDPRMKIKSREKAKLIIKDAKNIKKQFYFSPLNDMDEEYDECPLQNKKTQNPQYKLQRKSFKDFLYLGLDRREILLLNLYYFTFYAESKKNKKFFSMPMREIGKLLEIEESRVYQIHSSLLPRLKAKLTGKGLTLETSLNNL